MNNCSNNNEDTMKVYEWVDRMNLSRNKKNIRRDFSDGVLMAEVLKYCYPKLVNINNYAETHSVKMKVYNWTTLNEKVLKQINVALTMKEIESLANAESGQIEKLLMKLYNTLQSDHSHKNNIIGVPFNYYENACDINSKKITGKKDKNDYKGIIYEKEMEISRLKDKLLEYQNQIMIKEEENKNIKIEINGLKNQLSLSPDEE